MKDTCAECKYSAVCLANGFDKVVVTLMRKSRGNYTRQPLKVKALLEQELSQCKHAPFQVTFASGGNVQFTGTWGTLKIFDRFDKRVLQREIYSPAIVQRRLVR